VYKKVHTNPSWCVYEILEKFLPVRHNVDADIMELGDFEIGAELDNLSQSIRWDLEDRGRLL